MQPSESIMSLWLGWAKLISLHSKKRIVLRNLNTSFQKQSILWELFVVIDQEHHTHTQRGQEHREIQKKYSEFTRIYHDFYFSLSFQKWREGEKKAAVNQAQNSYFATNSIKQILYPVQTFCSFFLKWFLYKSVCTEEGY